ncbi:MAG: hypothetical protein HYX80_02970 [Chloroflexi bacterium]|nr:hypothetical protein [Chloroflexota bacterium]
MLTSTKGKPHRSFCGPCGKKFPEWPGEPTPVHLPVGHIDDDNGNCSGSGKPLKPIKRVPS